MTKRIFRATLSVALTVLLASRTAYIALGVEHEGMEY